MTHHYKIEGMTCNGCRSKVEKALNEVPGISANVNLNPPKAEIDTKLDISTEILQKALTQAGNYTINELTRSKKTENDKNHSCCKTAEHNHVSITQHPSTQKGKFYCPMLCEGDKVYDIAGNCPVCGMNLEKIPDIIGQSNQFTCPMHPEIIKDSPGNCPICGMNLVPLLSNNSEENKVYNDLLKKMKIAVIFTLPIFIIAMSEMIHSNPLFEFMSAQKWNIIQFVFSIPVLFYCGWMFFVRAWKSIISWNLNMFTLIGIGTGVAFVYSVIGIFFPSVFPPEFKTEHGTIHLYFEAATVIITLVLLGQLLEARAHSQTSGAIKELLKLVPSEATIIENGIEKTIQIQEIKKGDFIRVKPGDKIPVDGKIDEGDGIIDESMISGEPIPVEKSKGDLVTSGTINGNKSFVMMAEKVGSETLLSQIIQMVNMASRSRAPIQNLADKISKYFVPSVIIVSILTFFIWLQFGPNPSFIYGFINAVAVLIIACPCALGLATPMSVMVGVGKGAQSGILIKNAEALENLSKINVLITDKTGTLTEGKPTLEKVYSPNLDEAELLIYMSSLNQYSEHPLAKAVVDFAKTKNIAIPKLNDFESILGEGVIGNAMNIKLALGNKKLMQNISAIFNEDIENKGLIEQKLGKTVSFLAVDGIVQGFVVISDSIKNSSAGAVKEIMSLGIEVNMLTGDNSYTAKFVSDQLHLSSFKANCSPQMKLEEIVRLQSEGKLIAMAGDGINDAPALAQSNVGIAMGTGTDVAIESAKITLVNGNLQGIVKAITLSKAVMKNIKQNLFFAFFYNLLGVPIAAGILYPIFGILLSPMIAALAMSLSSVSVLSNSLRLRNLKI